MIIRFNRNPTIWSAWDGAERTAKVRRKRDGLWIVVERRRPDSAYDWFTYHFTRWGARRAVTTYLRTGKIRGLRP